MGRSPPAKLNAERFKEAQPSDSRLREPVACCIEGLLGSGASELNYGITVVVDPRIGHRTCKGASAPWENGRCPSKPRGPPQNSTRSFEKRHRLASDSCLRSFASLQVP